MARAWLLAVLLSCGAAQAAPAVRYCDYPVYPPISWSDGKQVRGLAPTVVKAVFASLGLDVEVVVLGNWKRCLMDAAQGRVDVVLAYRTPEREATLAFAEMPVLREEVAVFYNRQRPLQVDKLEDLKRYRGGLLFGESYGDAFDQIVARAGNIEWVSDSRQNFGKLIRGRIDFIPYERRTGLLYIEHLPGGGDLRALPLTLAVDHLRLAVSRHSPLAARMAEIDAELQRLTNSGEIERWLAESEATYRDMIVQPESRP
ncbi:transporter substrate-binding domain-containing protein [Metapseudomonas lalkuanensis]|uniref:Transporter substrate-binding domain-containing protein n=1 Tax=Metapseudomonas lalkuanensis TaxID=2604832 RepID=A0A5J6QL89_9GAMM|nr:transporter substrate-binding domain-containing protein [Pseudomonas lalkuanensis]QEY62041.1 transporter substrate-binding domain-containing protein [Pseudomonas lalkuanensis]UCO99823.1 transporter substrate-binding domain-containing protein [Pseudomonas lalkuanensis]